MAIRSSVSGFTEERALAAHTAILELASGLAALIENPKLLKQLGEDAASANHLNDQERQERDHALSSIAEAKKLIEQKDSILLDISKEKSALNANHAVNLTELEAKKLEHQKEFTKRENGLIAYESRLKSFEADLNDRSQKLDQVNQTLDQREKLLVDRESQVKSREDAIDNVSKVLSRR